jgi:hypothetical protein
MNEKISVWEMPVEKFFFREYFGLSWLKTKTKKPGIVIFHAGKKG